MRRPHDGPRVTIWATGVKVDDAVSGWGCRRGAAVGRHAGVQVPHLLAGRAIEPFVYRDRGISATIGRSDAVIQLPFGVKLRGLVAWLGWVGVHMVLLMAAATGWPQMGQTHGPLSHLAARAQRHRG